MTDIVTVVVGNVLRAGATGVQIVDALTSSSTTAALSANQGRVLAQQIADIPTGGGGAVDSVAGKTGVVTLVKADVGLGNVDNTSDANKPVSTAQATAIALKIDASSKGAVNGVASLDGTGKVPTSQLPSYVDDVVEFANLAAFPGIGEAGKIYVADDTNLTYRWSGSAYVRIADGDVSSVAGRKGDITLTSVDVGLGNVNNTSDAAKPISAATQTALNGKEPTVAGGNASQYYRGDKTFQTLDKTAVGLSNVDNTSDTNKPISSATQTALNLKVNTAAMPTTYVGATLPSDLTPYPDGTLFIIG